MSITNSATVAQLTRGHALGYEAGTAASWNGAPTTVQDAIDRMAALLKTLNGGTAIP